MALTVLVADDDLGIRLAVSDYLELSGYNVIQAQTGQQALEMLSCFQPHLLITDVIMPEMDGLALVRQVRKQPAFRLLPVIFLTARDRVQDRISGYQMGCDVYLVKPFELDELGAVVRNLLDRTQIMQVGQLQNPPLPSRATAQQEELETRALCQQLGLTDREREVLGLLSAGLSNALIGERLHLSARTVEKYVSRLLQKTLTHNRAELVRYAIQHHLLDREMATAVTN